MPRHLRYPHAAVASPHYLATTAGLAALGKGGNALDAVIAANLALGVVAPYFCGLGGDVFAIVWDGALHGYLGSGRSPGAASLADAIERHGEHLPPFGGEVVTVPGAVAGWFDLLERFGTRSFGDLAASAIGLARDGFEVTAHGAGALAESRAMYRGFEPWEAAYGAVREGDVLAQPAAARTYEALAADGPEAYYRGPIADAIVEAIADAGGRMSDADLAGHGGEWADPMTIRFRDVEIAELGPPTQGVSALEALRILDGLDAPGPGIAYEHLLLEATKAALADRDRWVTDPDAMPVPASALLADAWIEERRAAIDPSRAGAPDPGLVQPGGTAYLCAADADGMFVSLIQSNFVHFGSGVHVSEWGINLNNRGFSFSLDAARPNVLAPGKRPMHTLIPSMVLRDGAPWAAFGSMGGDAQVPVHVQVLDRAITDGADLADAIHAPRWRVDVGSWRVHAEPRFGAGVLDGLRALGHDVREAAPFDSSMGHAHAVWRTAGGYGATSDPRADGAALGL